MSFVVASTSNAPPAYLDSNRTAYILRQRFPKDFYDCTRFLQKLGGTKLPPGSPPLLDNFTLIPAVYTDLKQATAAASRSAAAIQRFYNDFNGIDSLVYGKSGLNESIKITCIKTGMEHVMVELDIVPVALSPPVLQLYGAPKSTTMPDIAKISQSHTFEEEVQSEWAQSRPEFLSVPDEYLECGYHSTPNEKGDLQPCLGRKPNEIVKPQPVDLNSNVGGGALLSVEEDKNAGNLPKVSLPELAPKVEKAGTWDVTADGNYKIRGWLEKVEDGSIKTV